jgi:hypothetical protein
MVVPRRILWSVVVAVEVADDVGAALLEFAVIEPGDAVALDGIGKLRLAIG